MNILFYIVFSSALCLTSEETIDFNPYEILDLDRSVSSADVRSTYKKLAKEWHPDKNKSPDAQDKFIKIQQAYEILSDENKREQYDTGGYSGDSVGQWQQYGEPTGFRYSDFSFTADFFNSHGSIRTLSMHDYYSRVLPESHNVPHLLYVYSTFCAQCVMWLRTSWRKAASDLEGMGVVVYTVDTTFTSRIASSLGVTRVPTIVGMYKERVHYFKGQISKEELKFFVNSFLPDNIITTVTSSSIQTFLWEIEVDDKPRVILFSDKVSPTLLYRLMTLKYQQYFRFGYVNMKDENSADVAKNFAVSQYGPTLLVFKDNTRKPAVVLGASEMPRGAINDILSSNKFVVMPRLTSQAVFDEVCAAPHGAVHNIRLCMILVSDPSFTHYSTISSSLKKLVAEAESNEDSLNEWMKFMTVHTSKQPAFTRSLLSTEIDKPELLLLWRRGQKKSSVKLLDVDFLKQPLAAARQQFQTCLRTALETAHLQQFQNTITLSPLADELAPALILQVLQRVVEVLEYVYSIIAKLGERQMMATIIVTILIILWINSISAGQSEGDGDRRTSENANGDLQHKAPEHSDVSTERDSTEQNSMASESSRSTDRQSVGDEASEADQATMPQGSTSTTRSQKKHEQAKPQENAMLQLVPSTYSSFVLNQSRGHMTIVLLLDDDSKSKSALMEEYEKAMKVFMRDPKMTITFLDVREYSSWYHEIRRSSSAQPLDEYATSPGISSLHGNGDFDEVALQRTRCNSEESPAEACGTVLALNGLRHWYCIFVPRGIKWGREDQSTYGRDSRSSLSEQSYAEALSCWMDRVREGQMPRLYVHQWPGLYSRAVEEDED